MATSPIDASIIASASDDTSVRIWSLDAVHRDQPCLCILAGEGHSWSLLSVVSTDRRVKSDDHFSQMQAFHDTGHYILSSGHDQVINLVRQSPAYLKLHLHLTFCMVVDHSGLAQDRRHDASPSPLSPFFHIRSSRRHSRLVGGSHCGFFP